MFVIGLTGGSGCGKSLVSEVLSRFSVECLDTDALYHSLVSRPSLCTRKIAEAFGENVLLPNGGIDREKLGKIVFAATEEGKEKLLLLNRISHACITAECEKIMTKAAAEGEKVFLLDAPLLFEAGLDRVCRTTCAVLSPKKVRIARIMQRDGITEEKAEMRIEAQKSDDYYRTRADFIFVNDRDILSFQKQISDWYSLFILPKIL
ncbi:MAG: dephospho-CoA kinase [Clostridia bacterium]|nr:dephospho-CoA kinase [Clostridia bacterium]